MLLIRPDSKQIRNNVFKRIMGGVQESKPVHRIAKQVVDELSTDLVLVDDPIERRLLIHDIYHRIENVHKVRRFNYGYASSAMNQNVSLAINEILYRFKTKYSRYF
ncbi:hypothetical protein [Phaeocystidibacter luteus]|uniref:Uncharacterized protein n=1 Tax=Phaeocystidibacter luteus TaxID=911197 RepID=A0A6N6RIJ3_9FLAO|nr:hypothetical protein [Phaeocystidibacter luteus]KAB2814216.1 hypothetical protein F8C67_00365 [Phaeocystidibacter luteus]